MNNQTSCLNEIPIVRHCACIYISLIMFIYPLYQIPGLVKAFRKFANLDMTIDPYYKLLVFAFIQVFLVFVVIALITVHAIFIFTLIINNLVLAITTCVIQNQ